MAAPIDRDRLRESFSEMARLKKELGEWADQDALDYGAMIKGFMEQGAVETLRLTQQWIDFQVEWGRREVGKRRVELADRDSPEFQRASLGRMPERVAREAAAREAAR